MALQLIAAEARGPAAAQAATVVRAGRLAQAAAGAWVERSPPLQAQLEWHLLAAIPRAIRIIVAPVITTAGPECPPTCRA